MAFYQRHQDYQGRHLPTLAVASILPHAHFQPPMKVLFGRNSNPADRVGYAFVARATSLPLHAHFAAHLSGVICTPSCGFTFHLPDSIRVFVTLAMPKYEIQCSAENPLGLGITPNRRCNGLINSPATDFQRNVADM